MSEKNSVWDYANMTEKEYAQYKALKSNSGLCVFCAKPNSNSDSLCEDHRLSYNAWRCLREIKDMPDLETRVQAEKILVAVGGDTYNAYKIKDIYDLLIEYKTKKEESP